MVKSGVHFHLVVAYVGYLMEKKLSSESIKTYLSGIKQTVYC